MKDIFKALLSFLLICNALFCVAQETKPIIDRIGNWRKDLSCGQELGEVIRTYKNDAVPRLKECCKKHSSACLNFYSSPDNKTLLYTAIEVKAHDVAVFLFKLSTNYPKRIDDYGLTVNTIVENDYFKFIETKGDPTSKTPLMLACHNGDLKGTQLLITYGASLLKRNYTKDGKTNKNAYEYAKSAARKDSGFMEYVEKEYKKQLDLYGQNDNQIPPYNNNLIRPQNNFALGYTNNTEKETFL